MLRLHRRDKPQASSLVQGLTIGSQPLRPAQKPMVADIR